MNRPRTLTEFLMERLADPEHAISYLQVSIEEYLEDGDMPFLIQGIVNVIEAQGGFANISGQINVEYQVLSDIALGKLEPSLPILHKIVSVIKRNI